MDRKLHRMAAYFPLSAESETPRVAPRALRNPRNLPRLPCPDEPVAAALDAAPGEKASASRLKLHDEIRVRRLFRLGRRASPFVSLLVMGLRLSGAV